MTNLKVAISMNFVGCFCIKAQAPIMGIMKLKCSMQCMSPHRYVLVCHNIRISFRNKAWFQFDDETVTEIKTLGDKRSRSKTIIDVEEEDDEK